MTASVSPDLTASVGVDTFRRGGAPLWQFEKHRKIPSKAENWFGGNRCDEVLKCQKNRRTETAVGHTWAPKRSCPEKGWKCMVIMWSLSFGSG